MSEKWEVVGKVKSSSPKGKHHTIESKRMLTNPQTSIKLNAVRSIHTTYEPFSLTKDHKSEDQLKLDKPEMKKTVKKVAANPKQQNPVDLKETSKVNLRVEDIRHLIESCQKKFPDSPLLWLRDLTSYLNMKLSIEKKDEVTFFNGLPLSVLSQNMKKAIYGMVNSLPDQMKDIYLDTCLTNLAHELSKNLSVNGWMIMIQVLTDIKPSSINSNLSRLIELRTSYLNRPHIGLMILWSAGQSGKKDLHIGVRVWIKVMLPLLSMKNYTKTVVEYLAAILSEHQLRSSVLTEPTMYLEEFYLVQDAVFGSSYQISKDSGRQMRKLYPQLRDTAFPGYKNHEIFPSMMERVKNQSSHHQVNDSLDIMAHCLLASPAALVHWHKLYTSHLEESSKLLQYLNDDWLKFSHVGTAEFRDTLCAFQNYENGMTSSRERIGVCSNQCSTLLSKMNRAEGSWFPWISLFICMLVSTMLLVQFDVQKNGSFEMCHTGHLMQDLGQYERVYGSFLKTKGMVEEGSKWLKSITRLGRGPAFETVEENAQAVYAYLYLKGSETVTETKSIGSMIYLQLKDGVLAYQNLYPSIRQHAASYLQALQDSTRNMRQKIDWYDLSQSIQDIFEFGHDLLLDCFQWARQQMYQLVK